MKLKSEVRGYTLIELLVGTGILSIAAIGIYAVATIATDWRRSSQEVKSLNMAIKEIDNSTNTTGIYSGVTLLSLNEFSTGFNSSLNLKDIYSPESKKLNFVYEDINSRICSDFSNRMLESSKNVVVLINGKEFSKENLKDVVGACVVKGGLNNIVVEFNKSQDNYLINTVVASINPPPSPPVEAPIPNIPIPQVPPTINAYTPSGITPGTYPLVTGGPPTFTSGPGGGGQIVVTSPPSGVTPVIPSVPNWNPPNVVRPGAPYNPPDQLDQDPNPPPPPPPPTFYSKQIKTCITGYAVSNLSYNCVNGFVDATLTLTLASPWDNFGRENFIFPRGVEHCNSGAPGFDIGYNQIYPQVTDLEMFWQATPSYNPRKMFIKTFHNINSYVFTCSQTG